LSLSLCLFLPLSLSSFLSLPLFLSPSLYPSLSLPLYLSLSLSLTPSLSLSPSLSPPSARLDRTLCSSPHSAHSAHSKSLCPNGRTEFFPPSLLSSLHTSLSIFHQKSLFHALL